MKKIKIMLTAIMLVAVVGGALAFKVKKGSAVFCGTQNAVAGSTACPLLVNIDYTTVLPPTSLYCTRVQGVLCTDPATTFTKQ